MHNTQPWRFTVTGQAIELYAETNRQLMEDLTGREIIISCSAALFGLRLAIRSLGYQPEVDLFPERGQRHLLARVRAGQPAPMTSDERTMLSGGPAPAHAPRRVRTRPAARGPARAAAGRRRGRRRDAGGHRRRPRVSAADGDPLRMEPVAGPTHVPRGSTDASRDAAVDPRSGHRRQGRRAAPCLPGRGRGATGRLPQRDFDLGRGWGFSPSGGPPAPVTAILVAHGEDEQSWLRTGQALQRILLRAASQWVFAGLQTQPLQSASVRAQIRGSLTPTGSPQLLLELGVARTTHPTARRPASEVTTDS